MHFISMYPLHVLTNSCLIKAVHLSKDIISSFSGAGLVGVTCMLIFVPLNGIACYFQNWRPLLALATVYLFHFDRGNNLSSVAY